MIFGLRCCLSLLPSFYIIFFPRTQSLIDLFNLCFTHWLSHLTSFLHRNCHTHSRHLDRYPMLSNIFLSFSFLILDLVNPIDSFIVSSLNLFIGIHSSSGILFQTHRHTHTHTHTHTHFHPHTHPPTQMRKRWADIEYLWRIVMQLHLPLIFITPQLCTRQHAISEFLPRPSPCYSTSGKN